MNQQPRIAPHASGHPNDDVLGKTIIGIWADPYGAISIHLSNGMTIHPVGNTDMNVHDAGAIYQLSKWTSYTEANNDE